MLKLNKLFYFSDDQDVFCNRIEPTEDQRKFFVSCKNEIRDYLRPRIRNATVSVLGMEKPVEPRFRTQGSWSYKTCVQRAIAPPQEIDWDFGVYLPVRVWQENGPPHEMAKAYFRLVEGLLRDLCKTKGWTLVSGKDTCIRVQVASWGHIDIPLYAAPEHEFVQILEKASLARHLRAQDAAYADSAGEMAEQVWEDLDQIVLATRSGEWKASDPEAVARWYNDRVAEHTEQLRRVCRYLKAWRDYQWPDNGGPTSVAIMIAVAQAFEVQPRRDDLALETAAAHLGGALLGELRETAIGDGAEEFNQCLSAEDKVIAARRARDLVQALREARALHLNMRQHAIVRVQAQFGERIPDRVDLIESDDGAADVRAVPARRVVAPVVPSTSAG